MPEDPIPITPRLWRELFDAADALADLKPWGFASDAELFALTDPAVRGPRVGHVLGNAGIVFGAVFYRGEGVRWVMSTVHGDDEPSPTDAVESMDCVKLEWVSKRELDAEDKAAIAAAGYKPKGRGPVWPVFRSFKPGWHPWPIDAAEAAQLVTDLAQLAALLRVFKANPDLFDGRAPAEIPSLRAGLPMRPLVPADLEWLPMLLPPEPVVEAEPPPQPALEALDKLKRNPRRRLGFDARVIPGASFMDEGRPCHARMALLVDSGSGHVEGFDLRAAHEPAAKSCQSILAKQLLEAGYIPGSLAVLRPRYLAGLEPLCKRLGIAVRLADDLPLVDEAFDALAESFARRGGPG